MPPKNFDRKRAAREETYGSDDGFVEDAPKSKRSKTAGNELKRRDGKATVSEGLQHDDEGNEYWELSKTRRIGLSNFKGKTLINIREYYEKDGKTLPGKKGISLSMDQFAVILDVLPEIESALESKGETVPRPKYPRPGRRKSASAEPEGEVEEEEDGGQKEDQKQPVAEPVVSKSTRSKLDEFKYAKKNHEATSDEDD